VASIQEVGGEERRFDLGLTTDLGRDPGSTIRLKDPLASRNHAEIRRTHAGRYRIIDLNSTHGTFVEGRRIREHLLNPGEEIMVGTTRLKFVAAETPSSVSGAPILAEHRGPEGVVQFPPADEVSNTKVLKANYEKLRAAYEISQGMALEEGLDGLLEKVLDVAIRLLDADRAAVLLIDSRSGEPEPRLAKTKEGRTADVKVSQSILQEVVGRRVGVLTADAGSDARFQGAKSIVATGIRSAMCVPMLHAGELLGVIHCDTLMLRNAFTEQDLDLFSTIANEAAVAVRNTTLVHRIQDEACARVQFQRFFSPGVVDEIISGKLRVGQKGELRTITVFFLDVRGFTRMSEGMAPQDVVKILNAFYERMVKILFDHGGTLDKYVGDELMALFGAPAALPHAPLAAVACAVAMMRDLEDFNATQAAASEPTLSVGIGIHSGEAVCGAIGSSKARQYTAMGDTVNTAARLCSAAKGGQILVSERTYEAVRQQVEAQALEPIVVKGKSQPLRIFHVTGLAGKGAGVVISAQHGEGPG
jgi:adenylate cyclase